MTQYIIKNTSGTFEPGSQPDGFKGISALENRLFICECPTAPNSEFVVEFPLEQQAQYIFYQFPNGKKLWFDPFFGVVEFGIEVDSKNRRCIMYSPDQCIARLAILKWFMLNVWIPDKARMYNIATDIVDSYKAQVSLLQDDISARTYIEKNLYYNL